MIVFTFTFEGKSNPNRSTEELRLLLNRYEDLLSGIQVPPSVLHVAKGGAEICATLYANTLQQEDDIVRCGIRMQLLYIALENSKEGITGDNYWHGFLDHLVSTLNRLRLLGIKVRNTLEV